MNLFKRRPKIALACIHDHSIYAQSEIGHDAVRRYYWICSKCGEKVYTRIGQGTPTVFPEHSGAQLSGCDRCFPGSSRK